MFIFKSTYRGLLNDLEHRNKSICDQHKIILGKDREINLRDRHIVDLKEALSNARDLKAILEKLSPLFSISGMFTIGDASCELKLPDNVPVYVLDYFGGKVIRQEATKVVVLDKSGNVKTTWTKKKADKGFSYLLVREK